jgi:FADH2 O2-dependent halogenase
MPALRAGQRRPRESALVTERFDLAIVGSGFSGSLLAAIARRIGLKVVLLEKGSHPRFAIGESTSPLANILLETLAVRHGLPEIAALSKWGAWQRRHAGLACGLKRGFTFYHHREGAPFPARPGRRDQLLVAASPRDDVADTHWFREDVDAYLVEQARQAGARYLDRVALEPPAFDSGQVRLRGLRGGRPIAVTARLLVDASGPRGFLHRALALPENSFPDMPATHALFSHFRGVGRIEDLGVNGGEEPPYPVDDAALHHVFRGGWIWILRFNNGLTSAGAVLSPALAAEVRPEEGEAAWLRLIARFPAIERQFEGSTAVRPFTHAAPVPFRTGVASGPGWAMLPSAAAFVDPLLSTGFPLTLLGIGRLAEALETAWETESLDTRLRKIARETLAEADRTARLVGALWRLMHDFDAFSAMTMFYFAAASFAEASLRLGRLEKGRSFLAGDDPGFQAAMDRACRRSCSEGGDGFAGEIRAAIEPRNVAGLLDPARRNWYPADIEDIRAGAGRLGATLGEVDRMLASAGLAGPNPTAA